MTETKALFMFLVLSLTFLGLAVNGEEMVQPTPEWDFSEKLLLQNKS